MVKSRIFSFILWLVLCIQIGTFQFYREAGNSLSKFVSPQDVAFAISLSFFLVIIAYCLGKIILKRIKNSDLTRLELFLFSIAIGLGLIAYGVFFIGLFDLLQTVYIFWLLVLISIVGLFEWPNFFADLVYFGRKVSGLFRVYRWTVLLFGLVLVVLILTFSQTLVPPWDYDGLMYHLEGPKQFLIQHKIVALPEIWGANGPFTIEMLFTVGLALGSDIVPKVINFVYSILLIAGVFCLGKRFLGLMGGVVSSAILIGIPIFPIWASYATIDIGWALYEFLALLAILVWNKTGKRGWLIIGGIMTGIAVGTKYIALGQALILGLAIIVISWRKVKRDPFPNAAIFGGVALLVCSPWYIKNWILLGNPFFPLIFGGGGWPKERLNSLMQFLYSFGNVSDIKDYFLLPINLYAHREYFATFLSSLDIPSILFPLIILYPWRAKNHKLDLLLGLTIARAFVWLFGSLQTRFLLPIFPGLSVLTAGILLGSEKHLLIPQLTNQESTDRIKEVKEKNNLFRRQIVLAGLSLGVVFATFIYTILFFIKIMPLNVLLGKETRAEFLSRNVFDFDAFQFIQNNLSMDDRVLLMWDGQGYYCDARCIPDTEQDRWTRIVKLSDTIPIIQQLEAMDVNYLLFSLSDLEFMLGHDPDGSHLQAYQKWLSFKDECTEEVFQSEFTTINSLTCKNP